MADVYAYACCEAGQVALVDVTTNTAGTPILHVNGTPQGIAITPDGTTAYVAASVDNVVWPITLATSVVGTPISTIISGEGVTPQDIAITPDGTTAYTANADGTSTVIDLGTATATVVVDLPGSALSVAISPDGTTAYFVLFYPDTGWLVPVSIPSNAVGSDYFFGSSSTSICITPDGTKAFVPDGDGAQVFPIDLPSITIGSGIATGVTNYGAYNFANGIACSPDGQTVYVCNVQNDSVTPITVGTLTAGSNITVGSEPFGVAFTPDSSTAYITLHGDGYVVPVTVSGGVPGTPIAIINTAAGIAMGPGPVGANPWILGMAW